MGECIVEPITTSARKQARNTKGLHKSSLVFSLVPTNVIGVKINQSIPPVLCTFTKHALIQHTGKSCYYNTCTVDSAVLLTQAKTDLLAMGPITSLHS
jgi:hypothetical protein